jgi:hypothetical protein
MAALDEITKEKQRVSEALARVEAQRSRIPSRVAGSGASSKAWTSSRTRWGTKRMSVLLKGIARTRRAARRLTITKFAHKAGVVGDPAMAAILAALDVAAERGRAAALDGRHHLEQHLDDADVGVLFQQVGGEAVPQRVRRHSLPDPGGLSGGVDSRGVICCSI